MTTPQASVVHQLSGRMRICVPQMQGNSEYFRKVEEELHGVAGVRVLNANPLTGRILLAHQIGEEDLLAVAEEKQLFKLTISAAAQAKGSKRVSEQLGEQFGELEKKVTAFLGKELDPKALMILGCVGASVYQSVRGKFLPAGFPMLLAAFNFLPRKH